MRRTGIMMAELFLEHLRGSEHIESADRLGVLYDALRPAAAREQFLFPPFAPATPEILALTHSRDHLRQVAATAGRAEGWLDADTQTTARSHEAACLAAGAVVEATRLLVAGELDNCFCLVRPPGHHAEPGRAMGFCLYNNIAVAANYARRELGLRRILIVDWDLHHGNGTQDAFYDTAEVLYFSTHQYPHYPGSGTFLETGEGAGEGYTINVPLPAGLGDLAYARIFNELLVPLAREYQPELIMVSAGFDIYHADPLGGMAVTAQGFAYLTSVLLQLAEELCSGRLLLTLEGGYNLTGLREGVLAVLAELRGASTLDEATRRSLVQAGMALPSLEQIRTIAKNYWTL